MMTKSEMRYDACWRVTMQLNNAITIGLNESRAFPKDILGIISDYARVGNIMMCPVQNFCNELKLSLFYDFNSNGCYFCERTNDHIHLILSEIKMPAPPDYNYSDIHRLVISVVSILNMVINRDYIDSWVRQNISSEYARSIHALGICRDAYASITELFNQIVDTIIWK